MRDRKISARAKRVWQRLCEWYGNRMAESYGPTPPEDWCDVVDRSGNDVVKRALSTIRQNYFDHPPTFPQFEKAFAAPVQAERDSGPSIQERLCAYVMRHHASRLTQRQIRGPSHYTYKRAQWVDDQVRGKGQNRDELAECTGVIVAADGESVGLRVTVEDMENAPDQVTFGSAA